MWNLVQMLKSNFILMTGYSLRSTPRLYVYSIINFATGWKWVINKLKRSVIWDIALCSPLKVNRLFGGTCGPHLQDRRISQARRNQHEAGSKQSLLGLFFDSEDGGDVRPKRQLTFNGKHRVISQRIDLFVTTAVRTLDPIIRNSSSSLAKQPCYL
jgi:hypothetical protein